MILYAGPALCKNDIPPIRIVMPPVQAQRLVAYGDKKEWVALLRKVEELLPPSE